MIKRLSFFKKYSYLLIFVLWALIYLPHLRNSPSWYIDETTVHSTAVHTASGKPSHYAFVSSFYHFTYPYQPVYTFVVGAFSKIVSNGDIWGSRLFNTFFALFTALLLYGASPRKWGWRIRMAIAVLFLGYDQSLIHFRMVYPHNGIAFGFALTYCMLIGESTPKRDWLAGTGLLLASFCHPQSLHAAIAAFLVRITRPKSWIRLFLLSSLYAIISLSILYLYFGHYLIDDIGQLLRAQKEFTESAKPYVWSAGIAFYLLDIVQLGALIGMVISFFVGYWRVGVIFLIVSFFILSSRVNLTVFYYQAVTLLPIHMLAWGTLFLGTKKLAFYLQNYFKKKIHSWYNLVFFIPIFFALGSVLKSVSGNITPMNHYWATQSNQNVEDAANWLNDHTSPHDVVIANPNLGWLLKSRPADWLQLTAWQGYETQYLDANTPHDRFLYSLDVENIRYFTIGDIDMRWTLGQKNVNNMLQKLGIERWPCVWRNSTYIILENPHFQNK